MARRGGFPGGMPGNMNNLMKQAQKMQRQMEEAQKQLEDAEVTAKAGGGAVEVTVSGKKEITKVRCSRISSWQQPMKRFARLMSSHRHLCPKLPVAWVAVCFNGFLQQ